MEKNKGPSLNTYVKLKLQKDLDISYDNILSAVDAGVKDDKHLKLLMHTATPTLFAYPDVSESIMKPLLNLIKLLSETKKDHKKLLRQLYALLQMVLGSGHAGSISADKQGEVISVATVSKETLTYAWEMLVKPTGDLAQQRVALKVMASVVRSARSLNLPERKKYADHLAQTLSTILNKDFQIDSGQKDRRIFRSITQKSQNTSNALHYLQTGALSAVRIALSQGGKQRLAPKGFTMLDCENSLAARHALALAVDLAGKNIDAYKEGIGPHLEVNLKNCGQEGSLYPTSESSSGRPAAVDGDLGPLNLHDSFARVYLARGCGMVVHDAGIQESRSSIFWKALVILACNDSSDLVSCEAIRAILGAPAPKVKDLTAGGRHRKEFQVDDQLESAEQGRRWSAWTAIVKEKPSSISGKEIDPNATIISRIVQRMQHAIRSSSQPAICGACRSAVELARTRAYATSSTRKNAHKVVKASDSIVPLQDDLMVLATSAWHNNAAQQSIALHALIWLQGTDGGPLTPPVLTNILSHGNTWSRDILSDLLQTLFQRLVVEPDMATYILDCVNAIVAGHPSHVLPVEIVDFWSKSFERASKTMVLRAALQFLEAPSPPRVLAGTGSDPVSLAHATEAAASLRKLSRIATWWLGEAANFISDEYAEFTPILTDVASAMSASSVIATECMRNPLLATTISHLQQSLLTAGWGVRHAAAESLIKIAFKSGEPFRIQIYKLFKEVLSGVEEEVGMDPFGLILVLSPAVDVLDGMYSGQAVIEDCVRRWGGMLYDWPEAAAQSLHDRHAHLLKSVQRFCKVGNDEPYYPLGSKSRSLLLGEEIYLEKQESLEVAQLYGFAPAPDSPISESSEDSYKPEILSKKQPRANEDIGVSSGLEDESAMLDGYQVHTNHQHYNGHVIEAKEWDAATEQSDESGSPGGQAHAGTAAATEAWGQVNGQRFDDQMTNSTFTLRNSVLSSVPSVGPAPSQASNTVVDSRADAAQSVPNSPQSLHQAPSNAVEVFEPRAASVMYDFIAELEGELSVTAGDVIAIIDEREGGWYLARLGENEGLVPCAYVAEPDM